MQDRWKRLSCMTRIDLRAKEIFAKADKWRLAVAGMEEFGKGVSVRKIDGFGLNNNGRMTNWLFYVPGSAMTDSLKWTNEKDML